MADNPLVGVLTLIFMFFGGLLVLTTLLSPNPIPHHEWYIIGGIACILLAFSFRFIFYLQK